MSNDEILSAAKAQINILSVPRQKVVTRAIALSGLGYPNPAYAASIFPFDLPAQAKQLAQALSSCGITVEEEWRFAGVDDERLYRPYGPRSIGKDDPTTPGMDWRAVTLEKVIAEVHGPAAWIDATKWIEGTPFPIEADACVIGCQGSPGIWAKGQANFEHIFSPILWADGLCHSVDGGQPGIAVRTRALVEVWTGTKDGVRTGELWAAAVDPSDWSIPLDPDGRPKKGRRFMGWVNLDALNFRD